MKLITLAQEISVNPTAPPGAQKFLDLVNVVGWFVTVAGVAAILVAGAMFGYEKWYSNGDAQAPKKVVAAIVGGVIASVAGPLMAFAVG